MRAAPSWLHNMSVPARSRVTVARECLDGPRFMLWRDRVTAGGYDLRWVGRMAGAAGPLAPRKGEGPLAWATRLGPAGFAALLDVEPGPVPSGRSHVSGDGARVDTAGERVIFAYHMATTIERARSYGSLDVEGLRQRVDACIEAAAVPSRSGVFLAADPGAATALGFGATLAVLARRSGPLYLPRRLPSLALVVPLSGVLFFPEA